MRGLLPQQLLSTWPGSRASSVGVDRYRTGVLGDNSFHSVACRTRCTAIRVVDLEVVADLVGDPDATGELLLVTLRALTGARRAVLVGV